MPKWCVQYVCPIHGIIKRIDKEPKDSARYMLEHCPASIVCDVGDDQEIVEARLCVMYD